jgi:hypothetical protein
VRRDGERCRRLAPRVGRQSVILSGRSASADLRSSTIEGAKQALPSGGVYLQCLNMLEPGRAGFGYDHLDRERKRDWPVGYALFCSAEARRALGTGDPTAVENARAAADWLIKHSDLDQDAEVGWGVPVARDTFRIGRNIPANVEYLVPTTFAIRALLDVCAVLSRRREGDWQTTVSAILEVAVAAARTFAARALPAAGGGIAFRYSTAPEHSYPVINATALFSGQLQRVVKMTGIRDPLLTSSADRAIEYLKGQREGPEESPCWRYYGEQMPPHAATRKLNDLLHECYTYDGLIDYKTCGGKQADWIRPEVFLRGICRFLGDESLSKSPRKGTPESNDGRHRWPELWGVGYALYVSSRLERMLEVDPEVSRAVYRVMLSEYLHNGMWRLRPREPAGAILPRQIAHVLLGLASYEFESDVATS